MATQSVGQAERRPYSLDKGVSPIKITGARPASLGEARDRAIYEAGAECGALARILRLANDGSSEFDIVLPGALMRIEALGTAVCCLLGSDCADEIAAEYRIIFGVKLELEVSND